MSDPSTATTPSRRGRPRTGVREAVLAATEAILAESGVARLSTKAVAARAGVAESSIFYHFGDRLGLLQAVVQAQLPPLKHLLTGQDRDETRADLRDRLIALLDSLEEFYLRTFPVAAAIQSDSELRTAFADHATELNIGPHRALDGVIAYLAGEVGEVGEVGHRRLPYDLNLPAAALLLTGAAHQRALQRHLSPPSTITRLATTADVVDLLIPALTRRPNQSDAGIGS